MGSVLSVTALIDQVEGCRSRFGRQRGARAASALEVAHRHRITVVIGRARRWQVGAAQAPHRAHPVPTPGAYAESTACDISRAARARRSTRSASPLRRRLPGRRAVRLARRATTTWPVPRSGRSCRRRLRRSAKRGRGGPRPGRARRAWAPSSRPRSPAACASASPSRGRW